MFPIHKEGFQTLTISAFLFSLLISVAHFFLPQASTIISVILLAVILFLVSFFRKPNRPVVDPNLNTILAPCDGKVVVIEKVFEPEYLKCECFQVSIFMSPLNVHINWFPISGTISYVKYHEGQYLAAWNPKAATQNERSSIGITNANGIKILVRQVAGALARRIVYYAKENQICNVGEELGFIKLGSRVDLYLPLKSNIKVSLGQKVKGNVSTIASLQL